jgi:anaerobic dimethyl sulfoxide reductase subunit C
MSRFRGSAAREWPLIGFTLLSQIAVGAFWAIAAGLLLPGRGPTIHLTVRAFPALIAVLILAAALSLFHLGRPNRAVFALNNWRKSWLSREIAFELIFLFLLALLALLRWRKAGSPALIQGILIVTAVAGIVFLFSMSRLYMLRTIPAWRGLNTPLSFFLSSLLLGPLFVAIARRVFFQTLGLFEPAVVIASLSAVLLIVLTAILFTPAIGFLGVKNATLAEHPVSRVYLLLLFRFAFLAAAILCIVLAAKGRFGGPLNGRWLTMAFLSALGSEISGRFLFYATYSRVGV